MSLSRRRVLAFLGGGVCVALSSLLIAILLLREAGSVSFAVFSLYQLTWTFAVSISTALLSSSILNEWSRLSDDRDEVVSSFFLANTIYSVSIGCVQGIVVWFSSSDVVVAIVYGVATALGVYRWFLRSFMNIVGENEYVINSDFFFALFSIVLVLVVFVFGYLSLQAVGISLIAANVLALIFSGGKVWPEYFSRQWRVGFGPFVTGFKARGGYATASALCVDLLNNSYAYIITFYYGAVAYAPVAFAFLLFRPSVLAYSTLTPLIRPRLLELFRVQGEVAVRRFCARYMVGFSFLVLLNGFFFWLAFDLVVELVGADSVVASQAIDYLLAFLPILLLRVARNAAALVLQVGDRYLWYFYGIFGAVVFYVPVVVVVIFMNLGVLWIVLAVCVAELAGLFFLYFARSKLLRESRC